MKKTILTLTAFFVLCLALMGCSKSVPGVSSGTYKAEKADDTIVAPTITFDLNKNTFTFSYDILSSTLVTGMVEIDDGKVTATTGDGDTYLFEVPDNDTIKFIQDGSSEVIDTLGNTVVTDGTEFTYQD